MLGSSILDVAIGMAFIYLLLSLIASAIQEFLAALIQARSANLERGIHSLFSGGKLQDGSALVDLVYTHGLIRGLYQDPPTDTPGYGVYTHDLGQAARSFIRWIARIKPTPKIADLDPFMLPAYIPARTFAITMIDILNKDRHNGQPPLYNIQQHLQTLCDDASKCQPPLPHGAAQALLALLADANTAQNAEERFRTNLENWYNDAMDRVSGWYKRYTQKILLMIGLVLAIVFNVDSIHVGRTLWFDRDVRLGLVSAAGTYTRDNAVPAAATPAAADATAPAPVDASADADFKRLSGHMETTVQAFNKISSQYLLPVGWHGTRGDYVALLAAPSTWSPVHIAIQALGWLVTAIALSLGAPFWFDTLNKFMVVRSTVKPQEKSLNEPSKS